MWQLLAQLNGMLPQISEAECSYILNLLFVFQDLPQLTGDPTDRNPLYFPYNFHKHTKYKIYYVYKL